MRGFPTWGIVIGLAVESEPVGGFFYMPITKDFFFTTPDGTVRRNDKVVSIKSPHGWGGESVLLVGSKFHRRYTVSQEFRGKIRSLGSTSAEFCYVATGCADGLLVPTSKVWDIAAGLAMLMANNGVLRYLDGSKPDFPDILRNRKLSGPALGGTPEMVDRFLKVLSPRTDNLRR